MASSKQVSFALQLLGKNGYSTKYMGSEYKRLGATMRERSGTVAHWLEDKNSAEISALIDDLQERLAKVELKAKQEVEIATPDIPQALEMASVSKASIPDDIRIVNGKPLVVIGTAMYSEDDLKHMIRRLQKISRAVKPAEVITRA